MAEEQIKLTEYSHGAGCGCKIAPQVLKEILSGGRMQQDDKNLLVGNTAQDDAAVMRLNDEEALITTTDFFTPIVDDPFVFGQVAAANAISDVYAMGGSPMIALAILGWPIGTLPESIASQVMDGAQAICEEAGIPLAGGHSIDTKEPIFGLSVNGKVVIKNLKRNNTAQVGDLLLLTKPIGVGILSTAAKRNLLEAADVDSFHHQLTQLNQIGTALGEMSAVHAMTDVTGFGLLGHLIEMVEGSGCSATIEYAKIPKLSSVKKYLAQNIIPDATYRNWNAYHDKIVIEPSVDALESFQLLPDPQTNGGLLIAIDPAALKEVQGQLVQAGYSEGVIQPFGRVVAKEEQVLKLV